MNIINSKIKDFYHYYHTSAEIKKENPTQWIVKTSPCTRKDFASAALDGTAFLVYSVALTIFSAIAVLITAGCISQPKNYFVKNAYEGIVYACSIPVSIVGMIKPKTINQNFLKLKAIEFKKDFEPGNLSFSAEILGGLVLRHRLPIYSTK